MRMIWRSLAWIGPALAVAMTGPVAWAQGAGQVAATQVGQSGSASATAGIGASAPAGAEPTVAPLSVGLFLGGFFPSKNHEFYDYRVTAQKPLESVGPDAGLRLGYYPLPYVGVEGEVDLLPFSIESGRSALLYGARAQVVLQAPVGRFTPFALAGLGAMGVQSDMDVLGDDIDAVGHLGLGAKFQVNRTLEIRLDGRYLRAPRAGTTTGTNHFAVLLGFSLDLGRAQSEAPAAPADLDGDGIVGAADHCPDKAGPPPYGCPPSDRDKDGLEDDVDRCPDKPETVNGYEDDDGCPDTVPDKDGDGLSDALDTCPDQPEDVDGFQDTDGCPDPDNDSDGVLDSADRCPSDKGPVENHGCPDQDKDGDGVVDRLDNCPDEPGTAANHGCKKKQLVVLTKTKLQILDRVFFHSNRDRVLPRSHRLLDNVAQVMTNHPELMLRIEGYTDNRGDEAYNKDLSQRRANSVMTYLVQKGVPAERLQAVGFGEDNPVASNDNPAGRAQNRRVEFEIASGPEQKATGGTAQPASGGATTPAPGDTAKPAPGDVKQPAPGDVKQPAPGDVKKPDSGALKKPD